MNSHLMHSKQFKFYERSRERVLKKGAKNNRGIVIAPPGFGKTTVITACFNYMSYGGYAGLMITPRIILNAQQKDTLQYLSVSALTADGGTIELPSDKKEVRCYDYENGLSVIELKAWIEKCKCEGVYPIVVSTYASCGNLKDIPFDFIVCDEAHNVTAQNTHFDVMSLNPFAKYLFVTATPIVTPNGDKAGQRGMSNEERYGPVVAECSFRTAIKHGFILPIKPVKLFGYSKADKKDTKLVDIVINSMNAMKDAMGDSPIPNKVVFVMNTGVEVQTIAKHAEQIRQATGADVFTAYSENASFLVNGIKPNGSAKTIREQSTEQLRESKNDCILVHIDTMGEGVDVPGITGCVLFSAGEASKIIQNIGRAMRVYGGDRGKSTEHRIKKHAIVGFFAYNDDITMQQYGQDLVHAFRTLGCSSFIDEFLTARLKDRSPGNGQQNANGSPKNSIENRQGALDGFCSETSELCLEEVFVDDDDDTEVLVELGEETRRIQEKIRAGIESARDREERMKKLSEFERKIDARMNRKM